MIAFKGSSLFCRVFPGAAMMVLGCAGLAKAYSADDFLDSLVSWQTIPESMSLPIAMLLPSIEWGLFIAYVMVPSWRSLLARMAAGLLIAFTVFLLIESIVNEAPMCNCFGKLLGRERVLDGITWMLWRNLLLVALLAPATFRGIEGISYARP